jgi:hypothetical protein
MKAAEGIEEGLMPEPQKRRFLLIHGVFIAPFAAEESRVNNICL